MRLCTLHHYYAAVWLPESDEIMHPAQLLCSPYGHRKVMRLRTLHKYHAPVWLPHTDEIMHPAHLLCTMGCSVLGRGAEPLVRTQFLEHPPTLNFGANHLKKLIQHPQKTPIPFLSPHNPHCRGGFLGGGSKS